MSKLKIGFITQLSQMRTFPHESQQISACKSSRRWSLPNFSHFVALVRERTIPTEQPRLSEKLVPTFADRVCDVVSVTDTYGRIFGFLDLGSSHTGQQKLLNLKFSPSWSQFSHPSLTCAHFIHCQRFLLMEQWTNVRLARDFHTNNSITSACHMKGPTSAVHFMFLKELSVRPLKYSRAEIF
jgi:hypothetical protein